MSKFNKEDWIGRVFRCPVTQEQVIITESMAFPGKFIIIGEGFLDLGDGYYSRVGGNVVEITEEENV